MLARIARLVATQLAVASLLLIPACDVTDPVDPGMPRVSFGLGAETRLATTSIGPGGGSLRVDATADTLAGLSVVVPDGAYDAARSYTISFAPITSYNGEGLTVLSPMIIVDNGGGYAEAPMEMTIPVEIPDDMFAMAFAFDEEGGLEGMPIIDADSVSVTIWTEHFEHSSVHGLSKATRGTAGARRSLIVIIGANRARLMNEPATTGFTPGTDDWAFANRGSQITPKGHCAGQTLGMMYYYIDHRQKGGASRGLNGLHDNDGGAATKAVWQDDRSAYRYCSVLQQARYGNFLGRLNSVQQAIDERGRSVGFRDSMMFMAFKLGMRATKQPQFVAIRGPRGGHAILTYGATSDRLLICDPNFPGKTEPSIAFRGGELDSYFSGATADEIGEEFPSIYYLGLTSAMRWDIARREWPSIAAKSAGARVFPAYTLKVTDAIDKTPTSLTSGWRTTTGKAFFEIISPSARLIVRTIFRPDGSRLEEDIDGCDIPDGRNEIGLYITDEANEYVDFRWFTILGKDQPAPPRCTVDRTWETVLTASHVVYTDSTAKGRRFILEDLGVPEDICSDVHVHPTWEVTGNLQGLTLEASAYWGGLWGRDLPLTVSGTTATGSMEIGLKQAYGGKPGWVGLQLVVTFPSRGSEAADRAFLQDHEITARIAMSYKQHVP